MRTTATIRKALRELEADIGLLAELRAYAKTEGGRTKPFGRGFIALAKKNNLRQSFVAKLLDISPAAVSQHYNR